MFSFIFNPHFPLLAFVHSEERVGQLTVCPARRIINLILLEQYFSIFEDDVSLSIYKVPSLVDSFAIEVYILRISIFEYDEWTSFLIKVEITHYIIQSEFR